MRFDELEYASPYRFTWRQKIALGLVPPAVAAVSRVLCALSRHEVRDEKHFDEVVQRHGHVLIALWHEVMPMAACRYAGKGFHALASYSFDGEMAARTVRKLGVEAVRGSSSRGGAQALIQLVKAARLVPAVGITVDGPRGPRRVVQPGIAILAARTGLPVVANAFAVDSGWRLRSWDRSWIQKPGSHVICAYAPPIPAPQEETPEAIEEMRLRVERALSGLHAEIEQELGCRE